MTGDQEKIYDLGRKDYFVEKDLGLKEADDFLHTENFVFIDSNRRIRGIYSCCLPPINSQNKPHMELIKKLRQLFFFKLLYWTARLGMALTFIISGIRKMPGVKFTILPTDDPVGHYFDAMHQLGFYWNFIGYFQIIVGILMLFNRTIVSSIIMALPVTVNIFLVSVALHMRGTPFITAAMLLGNLFLMLWHYEQYLSLLNKPSSTTTKLFTKS